MYRKDTSSLWKVSLSEIDCVCLSIVKRVLNTHAVVFQTKLCCAEGETLSVQLLTHHGRRKRKNHCPGKSQETNITLPGTWRMSGKSKNWHLFPVSSSFNSLCGGFIPLMTVAMRFLGRFLGGQWTTLVLLMKYTAVGGDTTEAVCNRQSCCYVGSQLCPATLILQTMGHRRMEFTSRMKQLTSKSPSSIGK